MKYYQIASTGETASTVTYGEMVRKEKREKQKEKQEPRSTKRHCLPHIQVGDNLAKGNGYRNRK